MCIRYFYKCFQGKICCQNFLRINMVFHFVKVKCPSSENFVVDIFPPKTTCIRWNFNNKFTFCNIILGTVYFVIPPMNIILTVEVKSSIGDWWKSGFLFFIALWIKNVYLPVSNNMSLIFNAFIVWSLCPDNKRNKITNFSDKFFKGKSYSKLLR